MVAQGSDLMRRRSIWCNAIAQVILVLFSASPAVRASEPADPRIGTVLLPGDTELRLKLLEPVASNTHKRGDRFALEVVEPLNFEGMTLIPAGATATGEVVHAQKAGFGGRAGELILASRFVQIEDQTIGLRSFAAANGHDRVNLALGLSFAVVGVFVTGKDIALPAGTDVFAKIAVDTEVHPIPKPETETPSNTEITIPQ